MNIVGSKGLTLKNSLFLSWGNQSTLFLSSFMSPEHLSLVKEFAQNLKTKSPDICLMSLFRPSWAPESLPRKKSNRLVKMLLPNVMEVTIPEKENLSTDKKKEKRECVKLDKFL